MKVRDYKRRLVITAEGWILQHRVVITTERGVITTEGLCDHGRFVFTTEGCDYIGEVCYYMGKVLSPFTDVGSWGHR